MKNAIKQCIIYYDNITIKQLLRFLTEVTRKSLKENREIRQKLGSENYHYQQCTGIPDALNSNYYLHTECFRKFIYAKTLDKRKCKDGDDKKVKYRELQEVVKALELQTNEEFSPIFV